MVAIAFALSLPGLVVVIILLGSIKLIRSKITGRRRPSSGSFGIDLLDTILKPGSEHRLAERVRKTRQLSEVEDGAPPFSKFAVDGKRISWQISKKS